MDAATRLGDLLAPLASHLEQTIYIANPTRTYFLLPDELLNMALAEIRKFEGDEVRYRTLTAEQREAFAAFAVTLRGELTVLDLSGSDTDDLINRNPHWARIRSAAQKCLGQLGFNLAEYEAHVIKQAEILKILELPSIGV